MTKRAETARRLGAALIECECCHSQFLLNGSEMWSANTLSLQASDEPMLSSHLVCSRECAETLAKEIGGFPNSRDLNDPA